MKWLGVFVVVMTILSCSNKPCKITDRPDKDRNISVDQIMKNQKNNPTDRVKVFKLDGTKQCNQGEKIQLATMAKELSAKDIHVFSSENKHTGLMYMQVCGGPTGLANIYEILESDLKKATSMGFSKWIRD